MEYNELMNGFAAKFAVKDFEIEDGVSALDIDGMTAAFIADEAAGTLLVAVEIDAPSPDADGPFGAVLLKANYLFRGTDGATLCLNPENGHYAVEQSFRFVELDLETLSSHVERLVNFAEKWQDIIAGFQEAEESAAVRLAEEAALDPIGNGFLQV